MARQEHILSVFVASPSDVEAERGKLEDVIRELNVTWRRELGISLELIRWETHAYPGMGADAQDVINDQIPDDYDIFLGIMWCRYGTQTGRAGSGTVEEFERAKIRHDSVPDSLQLMIYFKDEPVHPSQIDLQQLVKVNEFRESLGAEGTLYWKFNGIEQFEQLVRIHLARQIQAWKKNLSKTENINNRVIEKPEEDSDFDDEGILDLMDVFEIQFTNLTEISERIATATEEIGKRMMARTRELEALPRDAQGNANRKDAKRLIAKAASDMDQYTALIVAELPLFRDAMNTGMNSFIKAAELSIDFTTDDNTQQTEDGLAAMVSMRTVLGTSKESMSEFRETIASLPRMTTELNRAKRAATNALDNLLSEFSNGEVLLTESEKVIRDLLQNTGDHT